MNAPMEQLQWQFEQEAAEIRSLDGWKSVRDRWLARESGIITSQMKHLRELS
jgi:hypothetical protein